MAGNGRSREKVDEEELVLLVGVRLDAVDVTVAVDTVIDECVAVGRGEQRWGKEFMFIHQVLWK